MTARSQTALRLVRGAVPSPSGTAAPSRWEPLARAILRTWEPTGGATPESCRGCDDAARVLGHALQQIRRRRRMTVRSIACKAKVPERVWQALEAGHRHGSVSTLLRATCALGVSLADVAAEMSSLSGAPANLAQPVSVHAQNRPRLSLVSGDAADPGALPSRPR